MPGCDVQHGLASWLEAMHRLSPEAELGGGPLEVRQTHISLVLVGKLRVLKLKKPVNYGFLDYTTLDQRRAACEAEVRLNSRISPEMYLGVQPVFDDGGVPNLTGPGPLIDYGVLMKRLPADRMLDEMVRRDTVSEAIVDRLAGRLAGFHRNARRGPAVDVYGSVETIARNWEENFEQTEPYVGRTLERGTYHRVRAWVDERLRADRGTFANRIRQGSIVDGHGDVRCESVCVVNGITIFDCIEFNERFRCGDVAAEIAFLAMDLDALGRPDLGYYAAERYESHTGDRLLWRLLPFYRCYRAYVRGKVLSFRLDQPEMTRAERERTTSRAASYFELARRYAAPLKERSLVLVTGRSGTGKTALARALAGELGLRVVSTDAVRKELFGDRKSPADFGQGVYSEEATDRTYDALVAKGGAILGEDGSVVLDGTFLKERYRALARQLAAKAGAGLHMIECRLAPEEARRRIGKRLQLEDGLSDAGWQIFLRQQKEPLPPGAQDAWLALDTRPPLAICAREAADWLRRAEWSACAAPESGPAA